MDTWPHVETGPCHASWCDWSGFHWHWKVQRFRTMRELDRFQVAEMDQYLLEVYPSTGLP